MKAVETHSFTKNIDKTIHRNCTNIRDANHPTFDVHRVSKCCKTSLKMFTKKSTFFFNTIETCLKSISEDR